MSLSVFTIIEPILEPFVTIAAVLCCCFKARSLVRPQQGLVGARHEFSTTVLKHVYLKQWA